MSLFYRVEAFGKPCGPWRSSKRQAHRDAEEAGLGAFDDGGRFYLDAVANLRSMHAYEFMRLGVECPGVCKTTPAPTPSQARLRA